MLATALHVGKRPPGPSANASATLSSLHRGSLGQRDQIRSVYLCAGSSPQLSAASLGSEHRPNPNPKHTEKAHFG